MTDPKQHYEWCQRICIDCLAMQWSNGTYTYTNARKDAIACRAHLESEGWEVRQLPGGDPFGRLRIHLVACRPPLETGS
jgi:hypothetical protein